MITILYYLLKVILCSGLLFSYYWMVLRNKQFHQYNRFYLLGASVLSWLVPFFKINIFQEYTTAQPAIMNFANVVAQGNSSFDKVVVEKSSQFTWDNLLIAICLVITLFFMIKLVVSLWKLRQLLKRYPLQELMGLNLVMTNVKGTPFSFFKYIFWNTSLDLNTELGQKILAHEVIHVQENHSFDKLIIEIQMIIGWFNPFMWLIKNELYLIHEFIADQKSIENKDSAVLAQILISSAYPQQQHILANSFYFSPIKRRIQMLTQSSQSNYSYLRRLAILPILATTILLFSFRNGNLNARPIIKLDKQYTVIIDAGHGGEDAGAPGVNGETEKEIALMIAKKVKAINNNSNINIVLTRESDLQLNVMDRTNMANDINANLFVSIHMGNAADKKTSGATCYVPVKKNNYIKESTVLAKNILAATSSLFTSSKLNTTKDRGIWVIESVKMPAVLMECGFISNVNDVATAKNITNELAEKILNGVETYFSNLEAKGAYKKTIESNTKVSISNVFDKKYWDN